MAPSTFVEKMQSPPQPQRLRRPGRRATTTLPMEPTLAALGVALVVFASTNIDDIVLLSAFFSDPSFAPRQVIAGQLLGMAALIAASAACALLAVAIPPGWIALLGLAPLLLGLRGLWRLRQATQDDAPAAARAAAPGSRMLAVASITVANGADNLGVYIPLFSNSPRLIPLYTAVFAVMTAVWCAAGYSLVNNPILGKHIQRYGRVALPFVLIGLGLWILAGARALAAPS